MTMKNYKLCACDLDGTLVGTDMTVSDANIRAISELSIKGVNFVPCTGRTLSEMRETVDNPNIRYIIYSNGAAILDKVTKENTFLGLSAEKTALLMDMLSQFDCYIIAHYLGETYVDIDMSDENVEKYNISFNVRELIRAFAHKTKNLKNTVCTMDGIESLTVFFKSIEDTEKCKGFLLSSEIASFADGWSCNLEIFRAGTSKGNALLRLSEMLSIDIKDTIGIGDSGNDISMIRTAGLGLATSNACEALKEVADEIICSNDEGVVDYVLNKYFPEMTF